MERVRCVTSRARRATRRRSILVGLVWLPRPREHPGGEELRERLGVVTVGLLLRLGDRLQATRVHDLDRRDVRPDDPGDRERVAGRLHRDPIGRHAAAARTPAAARASTAPAAARTTSPASQTATSQKSRWTSIPIQRPCTMTLLSLDDMKRRSDGHTTLTDPCSRHTRAGRRGGQGNCRARSSSLYSSACPLRVLRQSPMTR